MSEDTIHLESLQAGEQAAWTRAFPALMEIALHAARHPAIGLSESDAQEEAVRAISELAEQIGTVTTRNHLMALLTKITSNNAVSCARHNRAGIRDERKTESLEQRQADAGDAGEPPPPLAASLTALEITDLVKLIERALAGVSERDRRLLREHLLEGKTPAELACAHGLTAEGVRSAILRTLRKLRLALKNNPRLMNEIRDHLRY